MDPLDTQPGQQPAASEKTITASPTAADHRPPQAGIAISDHWEDDWLRLNWDTNPHTVEHAYAVGLIGPRAYLEATRNTWLDNLDQALTASVAANLTINEALQVLAA